MIMPPLIIPLRHARSAALRIPVKQNLPNALETRYEGLLRFRLRLCRPGSGITGCAPDFQR